MSGYLDSANRKENLDNKVRDYTTEIDALEKKITVASSKVKEYSNVNVPGGAQKFIQANNELKQATQELEELKIYQAEYEKQKKYDEINAKTTAITSKEDFAQYSMYSPAKPKTDEELKELGYEQKASGEWYSVDGLGRYERYFGEDSNTYLYINDPSLRPQIDAHDKEILGELHHKENGYDTLTEAEIGAYNYLYYQDKVNGTRTADVYISNISPLLYERALKKDETKYAELAKESPIGSSIFSWGTNAANATMFPLKLSATAMGIYDDMHPIKIEKYGNRTETIRSTVSEDMSGIGRIAYNAGMSMGDMGVAFLAGGGDKILTQVIMSSSAGSSAISTAKENGASDLKAFITGIGSAAIEAATEKWSIEAILSNPKGTLGYILKNIVAEGSEEGASNVANIIFDNIVSDVLGERSEIDQRIGELVLEGKTETEALLIVYGEKVQSLGEDVLTGAFSGGGMSAITSIPSVVAKGVNKITNKPTQ